MTNARMPDARFSLPPAIATSPLPEAPPQKARRSTQPARKRLIARLWQNAERQVEEIEARLAGAEGAVLEQSAKTLAVLTRAVRDLVAIDADLSTPSRAEVSSHAVAEPPVIAIEQFRSELAEKLAALLGEGAGAAAAQNPHEG